MRPYQVLLFSLRETPRVALFLAPIFSFVVLALGTAAGGFFNYLSGYGEFIDLTLGPMELVLLFGFIPTLVLGLFWGAMTMRGINRLQTTA